jgi:glycoside/pentoside/hexuronide:cation symporter, GPH family
MHPTSTLSRPTDAATRPVPSTGAVFGYAVGSLGTGIFSTVPTTLASALGLMLVATALAIPPCSAIGRRVGESRALRAGVLGYGLVTAALGVACFAHFSWPAVLLTFAALGAPFAALQVLPFTLLAHTIHDECSCGAAAEGTFTGLWTAAEKLGLAMGPALMDAALAVGGEPKCVVPIFISIVPLVLMLAALLPLLPARNVTHESSQDRAGA